MEKGPPEYAQSTVHSSSATPTSEYGLNPSSSRSSTFPEYLTRQPYPEGGASRYHPPMANQSGGGPGMAPTSNPSSPLPPVDPHTTGRGGARSLKSDPDMVTDPGIAATSPTYPPPAPYASYPPPQDMSPAYPGQPGASNVYGRPPDWGHYPPPHPHGLPPAYGPHPSPTTTVSSASPSTPVGPRPGQVYSFVPIPGAQQHKRPRRRYEEIERMYKCGWNGCEKAYGTLNHLNAHVTMQSHGAKRTPEEFKEIRKEWKARKKDEDSAKKAEEDRQRGTVPGTPVESPNQSEPNHGSPTSNYPSNVRPQLPPIGYTSQSGQVSGGHYNPPANGIEQMQQYGNNSMYPNYPPSPYSQGGQVYQQRPKSPALYKVKSED